MFYNYTHEYFLHMSNTEEKEIEFRPKTGLVQLFEKSCNQSMIIRKTNEKIVLF